MGGATPHGAGGIWSDQYSDGTPRRDWRSHATPMAMLEVEGQVKGGVLKKKGKTLGGMHKR